MFNMVKRPAMFLWVLFYQVFCEENKDSSISHEGFEYTIFSELRTWIKAEEKCNSIGGHLVVIPNATINGIIQNLTLSHDENVWIGAQRNTGPYKWSWVNGTLVDMIHADFLGHVQGNNVKRYECGHIRTRKYSGTIIKSFVVYDVSCNTPLPYICRGKYCEACASNFYIHKQNKSWDEAKIACEEETRELAVIPEAENSSYNLYAALSENHESYSPHDVYWIGVQHHEWKWMNGAYITYANNSILRKEEDEGKNCLSINKSGNWIPNNCNSEKKFVCQTSESVSTTNTEKTTTESISTTDNHKGETEYAESVSTTNTAKTTTEKLHAELITDNDEAEVENGLIAGTSVGAAALLILIIVLISIFLYRKKQQNKTQQPIPLASNPNGTTLPSHAHENSKIFPGMSTSTPSRPLAEGAEGPIYSEPDINKKKHRESENVMVENDLYST